MNKTSLLALGLMLALASCTALNKSKKTQTTKDTPVHFIALGNEPNWSLKVTIGEKMQLKTLDENELDYEFKWADFVTESNGIMKANLEDENSELYLIVYPESCSDQMSENEYDYTTELKVRTTEGMPLSTYYGCGKYLPPFNSLLQNWELISVDDNALKSGINKPTLNLNLLNQSIYGNGGCNHYSGQITLGPAEIAIATLASTRMACPPSISIEDTYLQILGSSSFSFDVIDEVLVLKNSDHQLVFQLGK